MKNNRRELFDFNNKVVLITGASGGMGSELSKSFLNSGAKVIVHYNNNRTKIDKLKEEAKGLGENLVIVKADATKYSEVQDAVQAGISEFGSIDILINTIGVYSDAPVWKMNVDTWKKIIDTNLTGNFYFTKEVLPSMREKNFGRVINLSSVVGQMGIFGTSNYSASKSGLHGFTRTVAMEVVNKNITVNTISMGYFDVGMFERLTDKVKKQVINKIPMKRPGRAEEIVHTVLFLASENASYITGQVINVNGGLF